MVPSVFVHARDVAIDKTSDILIDNNVDGWKVYQNKILGFQLKIP